ncbi:GSU2403 family nucleotidyltransferase fold protein [Roseomonas sp. CCTCC AB2023176]|uniref:GSU2403 family nucleotidyltransferase fold protein n=1 Tax=Roseomonas sp. CCTCC AB2023176 TaxID=3342640 RepID=UPI0035DC6652
MRRLDAVGVLGRTVCVVGTNALFAYETHAGIRFGADLLATGDVDLALDARRNLALAGRALPEGLLAELRRGTPASSCNTKARSARSAGTASW